MTTLADVSPSDPRFIHQSETLYTTRPRYFTNPGDRGPKATLRILNRGIRGSLANSSQDALAERVRKKLVSEDGYIGFLVENLNLAFREKLQVVQTMGDAESVYYFGRTPTEVQIAGTLIDDADNDWFVRFVTAYNEFMRGTQLARNFELIQLSTYNATFTGTFTNLQIVQNSQDDVKVSFSASILLKSFHFNSAYRFGDNLADDTKHIQLADKVGALVSAASSRTQEEIATLESFSRGLAPGEAGAFLFGRESASIFPSGIYAVEAIAQVTNVLGGIASTLETLAGSINRFSRIVEDTISDVLNPINELIGAVSDISNAVFSVMREIDGVVDSVLDPITVVTNNFANTQNQIKNLTGAITTFPENLSEKISRFARSGGLTNTAFLKSPSAGINSSDALAIMKGSNIRTPARAARVDPGDTSGSADDVARL